MKNRSQRFDPRQFMQTDTFEVFHYQDPRPGGVDLHHHDFYEVYYLLSGQVEYWVDGRVIAMQPGDLLLINPLELHRPLINQATPAYERIVLWINKAYLEHLTPESDLSRCFDLSLPNRLCPADAERPALQALMQELTDEYYSQEFGSHLCAQGLFLQLMVKLNRLALHTHSQDDQNDSISPLVKKAIGYIRDHIGAPLSLEEIAGQLYVSKYHLAHTFRKETGVSLYRYIMLRRLLLARQHLSAGQSAGQVCHNCGFSDYTSFYRAFKAEYGISPKEYSIQSAQK